MPPFTIPNTMRKFKVIALNVSGKGNKIHYLNDEVTEGHFPEGRADDLVEQGFLKEIKRGRPSNDDTTNDNDETPEESGPKVLTVDDFFKKHIVAALECVGAEFELANNKKELWAVLFANEEHTKDELIELLQSFKED